MSDTNTQNPNTTIVKNLVGGDQFKRNYEVSLDGLVEKRKGRFDATYLSWPTCVRLLREHHGDLFVDFERDQDGSMVFGVEGDAGYLLPFLGRYDEDNQVLYRTPPVFFPLMSKSHESLTFASGREINDNMMRASVKAVAIHTGLGLKVFEGEDIPTQEELDGSIKKEDFIKSIPRAAPYRESNEHSGKTIALDVPFEQKDQAKSLGARWNKSKKVWEIDQSIVDNDPSKFSAWIDLPNLTDEVSEQTAQDNGGDEDEAPF